MDSQRVLNRRDKDPLYVETDLSPVHYTPKVADGDIPSNHALAASRFCTSLSLSLSLPLMKFRQS